MGKIMLFILMGLLYLSPAARQMPTGEIKGKVTDHQTTETLIYVTVVLFQGEDTFRTTVTDYDGNYRFSQIPAGTYNLTLSFIGYQTTKIEGISVSSGEIKKLDLSMYEQTLELKELDIVNYKSPVFKKGESSNQIQLTEEEIKKAPTRSLNELKSTSAGVYSNNSAPNIKGNRPSGTIYFIDGVRIRGLKEIPQDPVENGENFQSSKPFNTEDYDPITENEFKGTSHNPLSTFSIDVDKASYSNVRRYLTNGMKPPAGSVRIEELINYFNYSYNPPQGPEPFSFTTEMAKCPWNEKHFLLKIGIQGKIIPYEQLPPSNYVFLLDVSGSMNEPNKLPLVKRSMELLVKSLRKEDKVAIVVYAGAAGVVLESTPGNKKEKILEAINNLNAGGSTAGGEGIKLAYKIAGENFLKKGNNRVILATDGDFNVGVSSDAELVKIIEKERESGIYLTALGFGMGNYKDNKLEKIADKGNGNYAYIDNYQEAVKVFGREIAGTLFTIAKDVKIQVEFNPSEIKAYRLIGYENRMLAKEDFNDDTKDAGELGAGHTVTALYELVPADVEEIQLPDIDKLRYSVSSTLAEKNGEGEAGFIKLRYKEPGGTKSLLLERKIEMQDNPITLASENFRFASAVALFGMILRESDFVGDGDYGMVKTLTKNSITNDEEGHRHEFVRLVALAEKLE